MPEIASHQIPTQIATPSLISHIMDLKYDLWWHVVRLFRPDNLARTRANIFGNISSFNMLCLPHESGIKVSGMPKIENAEHHPLRKEVSEPAKS